MRWHLSNRASKRGVKIADRHYSRQKPRSPQFVKPGSCVVMLTDDASALWVTSWPVAEYVKHAWAGAWECSLFRNEGGAVSSELITEAVAATRAVYGDPPPLGIVTFIDPAKVEAVIVRGLPTFGYSWRKAGWKYVGRTKAGLLAFHQTPGRMPEAVPPVGFQPALVVA